MVRWRREGKVFGKDAKNIDELLVEAEVKSRNERFYRKNFERIEKRL